MPNSRRMVWPYPSLNADPWYDTFESMVTAMDSSSYANREDRGIFLAKGGSFSFNASTGILSWDDVLEMHSPVTGYRNYLPSGSVTILDGQFFYVNLTRWPLTNVSLSPFAAGSVPNTDDAYVLAARRGDDIYFRSGVKLSDGETKGLFSGGFGAAGQKLISSAWITGRDSHDSDTPKTVGAFAFNPTEYQVTGTNTLLFFRAVAANGYTGITTHVKLRNATDGEDVAELSFTSTSVSKDEASLVVGAGSGLIKPSERVYEVLVYLDAPKVDPMESVELYSAELRVISQFS